LNRVCKVKWIDGARGTSIEVLSAALRSNISIKAGNLRNLRKIMMSYFQESLINWRKYRLYSRINIINEEGHKLWTFLADSFPTILGYIGKPSILKVRHNRITPPLKWVTLNNLTLALAVCLNFSYFDIPWPCRNGCSYCCGSKLEIKLVAGITGVSINWKFWLISNSAYQFKMNILNFYSLFPCNLFILSIWVSNG